MAARPRGCAAPRHAAAGRAARRARTPGRDRSIRDLAYHVYQVADAFLQAVEDGKEDLTAIYNAPPPAQVRTAADIRAYGVDDRALGGSLATYYGAQPLHHVLERCTWHSAQHARQIAAVLESFGIAPERPLTAQDYAGLPMPAGLWE